MIYRIFWAGRHLFDAISYYITAQSILICMGDMATNTIYKYLHLRKIIRGMPSKKVISFKKVILKTCPFHKFYELPNTSVTFVFLIHAYSALIMNS